MPWQNSPPFSLAEAVQNGHDVYEVIVTQWGLIQPGAPAPAAFINTLWPPPENGIVQPGVASSLAGIAIGARSTVDRCLVTYNLQGPKAMAVPQEDRVRRLSVESPLYFVQAANIAAARANVALSAADNQTTVQGLYAWSGQTFLAEPNTFAINNVDGIFVDEKIQYVGLDGALHRLFDSGISGESQFEERPTLHLVLYLKQPLLQVPALRAPMVRKGSRVFTNGNPHVLAKLPVFGRKNINVKVVCGSITDFTITSLQALTNVSTDNFECLEASAVAVPADKVTEFKLDNIGADYLIISADPAGASTARWSMIAEDR
jgi:hypothetical protein